MSTLKLIKKQIKSITCKIAYKFQQWVIRNDALFVISTNVNGVMKQYYCRNLNDLIEWLDATGVNEYVTVRGTMSAWSASGIAGDMSARLNEGKHTVCKH